MTTVRYSPKQFIEDMTKLKDPLSIMLMHQMPEGHKCPVCEKAMQTFDEFVENKGTTELCTYALLEDDEQGGKVMSFFTIHGECVDREVNPRKEHDTIPVRTVSLNNLPKAMISLMRGMAEALRKVTPNGKDSPIIINRCHLTKFIAEKSDSKDVPILFSPKLKEAGLSEDFCPAIGSFDDDEGMIITGAKAIASLLFTQYVLKDTPDHNELAVAIIETLMEQLMNKEGKQS